MSGSEAGIRRWNAESLSRYVRILGSLDVRLCVCDAIKLLLARIFLNKVRTDQHTLTRCLSKMLNAHVHRGDAAAEGFRV